MAELNFSSGDYIRLRLAQEEIEGQVLLSHDSSIVLLKLNSGYNIGIPKDNILGSRILKRYKEQPSEFQIPENIGMPKIVLGVTGGTIASKLDRAT